MRKLEVKKGLLAAAGAGAAAAGLGAMAAAGLRTARNAPFPGGYILRLSPAFYGTQSAFYKIVVFFLDRGGHAGHNYAGANFVD